MKEFTVREDTTLKTFTDNYYAQASFCFRTLLKAREIRVNGARVSADMPLKPEAVFSALCERGETYFIHRLDRNTAGLLIFAKNAEAEGELLSAFRDRRVEKIYLARVVGCPKEKHAVCTAYLKKDAAASRVRVSSKPVGEKIITEYEVVERGETSLLRVTLHTGKTHQIRAHLAFLGFPIVGDEKYGDGAYNRAHNAVRQKLVAKRLTLHCAGALAYLDGRTFLSSHEV